MSTNKLFSFVKIPSPDPISELYWLDINGDGRQNKDEFIKIPKDGQWDNHIVKYIQSEKRLQALPSLWAYNQLESTQEYFAHPEKNSFELQLIIDIGKLERMPGRPEIFTQLLMDLRTIKDELQYTRFQYAEEGELEENTWAIYDITSSTVITRHNPSTATLIHEMDHALTYHRRTDRKVLEQYPKIDSNLKTGFEFYLDYPHDSPENNRVFISFNALMDLEPILDSPDPKNILCLRDENIEARLASETHAFQTMARYWLYQMGVTEEELKSIQEGGSGKRRFMESLLPRITDTIKGSNLDPYFAHQILIHYFVKEGFFSDTHLKDFVKETYTELKDSGFVDSPNCIPRPERQKSGGCSTRF